MSKLPPHRNIHIEESAVGSAIVSGDGNSIYVIHQVVEKRDEAHPSQGKTEIGLNPYKGLAAFKERDADRYFGRETQVERLMERFQLLHTHQSSLVPRFLPILGPSGCGKSSLARAGFIPSLAQQPLPGKDKMRVAVLVPGSHPLEALAGVLAKVATNDPLPLEKAEEFERVLKKTNDEGEHGGLRRIASLIPGIQDSPLVILVDQFEEVYSLCQDLKQRRTFIDNLLHATSDPTGNISLVITLRTDFLGETQQHERLNSVISSDRSVIVPAMTTTELRRAIAEPAKLAGHPFDEATIELILKDTVDQEGALPLLQFALTRIWDELIEGKSPVVTYREMGGIGGALAVKAQEVYDKLTYPEKEIARRIFVGLIQIGEGSRDTRRRVLVRSLIACRDNPEVVQHVIRQFSSSGTRLIVLFSSEGYEIAEVAHEALFEHWQQLHDWLESSRDDIRLKRRLETVAQYWDEKGQPDGLLWRSPDLDLLKDYQHRSPQDMTKVEAAFSQASYRSEQRRKQNKRLVTGGLVLGFILTSLSTSIALWKVREANYNNVRVLVQSAATLNASGESWDALMVALRAGNQFQDGRFSDPSTLNEIKHQWLNALSHNNQLHELRGHSGKVNKVRFSPDGKTIAISSAGAVELWQVDGSLVNTFNDTEGWIVGFSPDGSMMATVTKGNINLWKLNGTHIATLEVPEGTVNDVHFSPDGTMIAAAVNSGERGPFGDMENGTAKLWNTDGTLITTLEGHSSEVYDIDFSPNGNTIITASADDTAKLWKTDGTLINTFKGHERGIGGVVGADFSPDGNTIITASSADDTVKLWQIDGSLLTTFNDIEGWMRGAHFSPDDNTIATVSGQEGLLGLNTVRIWRIDGTLIATFEANGTRSVDAVHFNSDNNTIATTGTDGIAEIWQIDGRLIASLKAHSGEVHAVRFSPDGNTIVTVSFDGTAKLWPWSLKMLKLQTCQQIQSYLQSNPNVDPEDRDLCD